MIPFLPRTTPVFHRSSVARGLALFLLSGCSLNAKPDQPAIMKAQGITATVEGLRSAVLGQSQDMAEAIERTADTIAAQTTAQQVRINAIQWKLVSSIEIETAALARDPAVALADLLLFNIEMQAFLTTGEGRDLFGVLQALAVQTNVESRRQIILLVDRVSPPGTSTNWLGILQPIADRNPIVVPFVGRVGLTDSIAKQISSDRGALASVGDIEVTARILDRRIEQVQRNLLKQARWEADLVLAGAIQQPLVDSLTGELHRITASLERVTAVAEGVPDLVDRERVATMLGVAQERIAVLAALTGEREAVLRAIASERVALLAALHEERIATMRDAEGSATRLIDHTLGDQVVMLVDRILLRIFLGFVLLILLGLGGGLLLIRAVKRTGAQFST